MRTRALSLIMIVLVISTLGVVEADSANQLSMEHEPEFLGEAFLRGFELITIICELVICSSLIKLICKETMGIIDVICQLYFVFIALATEVSNIEVAYYFLPDFLCLSRNLGIKDLGLYLLGLLLSTRFVYYVIIAIIHIRTQDKNT